MLTIFGLKHCTTTQKAKKYLESQGIEFHEIIDIRDNPPSPEIIKLSIEQVNHQVRKMMNTSGGLYREMGLKDKLDTLSEAEVITLLSEHGMLIKRPLITDGKIATTGAKEKDLETIWVKN